MTQAFLFFSFQLALPKTSVLLLCQRNSDFLTFFYIVFCPLPLSFAFGTFRPLPFSILQTAFCPLLPPFCCFLSFLCVGFTFCVTFDGNLLQKFVTRQKV